MQTITSQTPLVDTIKPLKLDGQDIRKQLQLGKQRYTRERVESRNMKVKNIQKEKQQRVMIQNYRAELINRPAFISTTKFNPEFIDKNTDQFNSNEPFISEFQRLNSIVPQRVLEHGVREIICGATDQLNGSCFPNLKINQLSPREKQLRIFWESNYSTLTRLQHEELLNSQTGLIKKLKQQQRLKNMQVFKPNSFSPELFNKHPSNLYDIPRSGKNTSKLITLDRNFNGEIWVPPNPSMRIFNDSLLQNTTKFIKSKTDSTRSNNSLDYHENQQSKY